MRLQAAVDGALQTLVAHLLLPGGRVGGAHRGGRAVRQEDFGLADVVDEVAVGDGVGAGGIVGEHAAHRGAVGTCRIGAHHEAVLGGGPVHVVERYAGLHPGRLRLGVDLEDAIQMVAKVDDQRLVDALPGQRRAAAAGQHGNAVFMRHLQGRLHILFPPGDEDADRFHGVHARVRGVERPHHFIGVEFARNAGGKSVVKHVLRICLGRRHGDRVWD